jgi:DNA-binding ferritin-like protein (Dps family)
MLSPWADDKLGEPLGFVTDDVSKKIYYEHLTKLKEHQVFYKILDLFDESPNAVEGMMDFYLKNNIYQQEYVKSFTGTDVKEDHHPNPAITLRYAREILAPKLKELYEINTDNLFDTKLDEYASNWMYFLRNEYKKILDNGLWLNDGNYIPHSFKPYVPWYVKNNEIFEYKLPLN